MGRALSTAHDRFIGQRIREARIAAGLSQEDLGHMIGLSYQQVQKYETGRNRVNGARFDRLVTALNRPLAYFFPNSSDVRSVPAMSAFLTDKNAQDLVKMWPNIGPSDRSLLVTFAKRLTREQP